MLLKRLKPKSDYLNQYYYIRVNYTLNKKKHIWQQYIHRLVAMCFIPNPLCKPEVNHIDGNKFNNSVENLEWATRKENMIHAKTHELLGDHTGEKNGRSRLTEQDVIEIRSMFEHGWNKAEIAREFNVGWTTIQHIINRDTWKFL